MRWRKRHNMNDALCIFAFVCYTFAVACVGAAFAFGHYERRNRKSASQPKRKPLNLTV